MLVQQHKKNCTKYIIKEQTNNAGADATEGFNKSTQRRLGYKGYLKSTDYAIVYRELKG